MKKIKIGVVGFGLMGRLYADALMKNNQAELAAVADLKEENRKIGEETYHCQSYDNYEGLYGHKGLDAVIITLPDFMHRDPVVKASQAGVHILVEKPFAMNIADAKAMKDAIEKAGVKCMVEFFNRWSPPFAHAKTLVARGDLGEVLAFNIELNDAISVPTKMLAWSGKSSPVWFLMSHTADLAFWIKGCKPVSVTAAGVKKELVRRGIDTYDLVEALVEFEDGTLGRLTNCWVLPNGMPMVYELKMRIVGNKTAIDIDTSDQELHLITDSQISHPITAWGNVLGRYVGHPFTMLDAFVENIVNNTEPLVGVREGWENTVFLAAVDESLACGKKIKIQW